MKLVGIALVMAVIGVVAYYRYEYGGSHLRLGLELIVEAVLALEFVKTLWSK
jgi:hypothetical protein